ncbi:ribosomal protein S18 [Ceratocystis lukuohia]|uniref:Small ribosomal subunit protein bS18m n=3 Tax=Ceratocystis TaxID=5157 RepID=A0A0F8B1A2_CERFI|nr:37S ribosomal protein RSM18 mitochondrial [Ceratocystis platani]PHH49135.1 37S ribosomal protein rsm18, mitochondrial [Ceratocystis fimbriata CBS 114723]
MIPRLPLSLASKPAGLLSGLFTRAFSNTSIAAAGNSSSPSRALLDVEAPSRRQSASKHDQALRLMTQNNTRVRDAVATHKEMAERRVSEDYLRQAPRQWKRGDVYAPRDMSFSEMAKWKRSRQRNADVIDILGINPLDEYLNPTFIADFTTSFGQIQHSKTTGLRPVNQRKVAKTIRRAIGMGLHPSVHRHPEILREEFALRRNRR